MARYIDSDMLRKNEIARFHCVPCVGSRDSNYKYLDEVLNDTPTADVQEVRHGKWYWYEEPHSFYDDSFECGWKCSYCNNYPDHDNYVADDYENKPELKYCNNCGALMDGKE